MSEEEQARSDTLEWVLRQMRQMANAALDDQRPGVERARIEQLEAALEPGRLRKIIGEFWVSSPKETEILDRCVAAIINSSITKTTEG